MNALLGLPTTRVKRVNPLSIFFLMHLMVSVLGAASAGALAAMLAHRGGGAEMAWGLIVGLSDFALLQVAYFVTILRATADTKLHGPTA